jgi:hypothetical protein
LKFSQELEQECLEFIVGPINFVDEQDGRRAGL